jgi:hypothetical protein
VGVGVTFPVGGADVDLADWKESERVDVGGDAWWCGRQSFLWLCMGLVCLGRSQDCCKIVGAWGVEWDLVGRTIGDKTVPLGRFSLLSRMPLVMTSSEESSFGSVASRSVTCTPPNSFWRLASLSS